MTVKLIESPQEADRTAVKQRALVTMGKDAANPPTDDWLRKILRARHSPIRRLWFSFYLEIPSWVSVHLVRHVHAQPFVQSQRNDRQSAYDRNKAPQDAPVKMILDVNAEELINIANKRLCAKAAAETREVVTEMCRLAAEAFPAIKDELVPVCVRNGHRCYEMDACGKYPSQNA